jgi:hypothetical protein
MAFNLGGLKSTFGGAGNGLNVGGLLNGGFSIGGTFNSLNQKDKIASRPNSELKELYPSDNQTLQYPMDLDNVHYMMFTVTKRFSQNPDTQNAKTASKALQTIVLPLPLNLQDQRSVQYNNSDLGILGGLGAGQINAAQVYSDVSRSVKQFGGAAVKGILNNAGGLGDKIMQELAEDPLQAGVNAVLGLGTAAAISKMGLGQLTGAAALVKYGQGLFYAQGASLNPRMATLFDRVSFREFGFGYKMIARNQTESEQIRKIVRAFQTNMLPSYFGLSNSGFIYPNEFQIQFSQPLQETLFTFNPCVLKNVSVTYNADTGPAFFEGTNEPLIVDINLQFQETQILTKELNFAELTEEQKRTAVSTISEQQNAVGDYAD